jgi:hypothetical protein
MHLSPNGYIVIHDCMPMEESWQVRDYPGGFVSWTGDVWKFQAWLVSKFFNVVTINEDCGCGIIQGPLQFDIPSIEELLKLTWKDYSFESIRCMDWNSFKKV